MLVFTHLCNTMNTQIKHTFLLIRAALLIQIENFLEDIYSNKQTSNNRSILDL